MLSEEKFKEVELDCHMDFDYDDDYRDVIFASTNFQIIVPREIEEQFKAVHYKEWDKLFIDLINTRIKEANT